MNFIDHKFSCGRFNTLSKNITRFPHLLKHKIQGLSRPNSPQFKDPAWHSMRHGSRLITVTTLTTFIMRTSRLFGSSQTTIKNRERLERVVFSNVQCYSDSRRLHETCTQRNVAYLQMIKSTTNNFNWLRNNLNLILIRLNDLHKKTRPPARGYFCITWSYS